MFSELDILSDGAEKIIRGTLPQMAAKAVVIYGTKGFNYLQNFFFRDKKIDVEIIEGLGFDDIHAKFQQIFQEDDSSDDDICHLFKHNITKKGVLFTRYSFTHTLAPYAELQKSYKERGHKGTDASGICEIILGMKDIQSSDYNFYKVIFGHIFLSVLSIEKLDNNAEKYLQYKRLYRYVDYLHGVSGIQDGLGGPSKYLAILSTIKDEIRKHLNNNFKNSLRAYLPTIMNGLKVSSIDLLISNKIILDMLLEGGRIDTSVGSLYSMRNGFCGKKNKQDDVVYTDGNPFNSCFKSIAALIDSIDNTDDPSNYQVDFPSRDKIHEFLKNNIEKQVFLSSLKYPDKTARRRYEKTDDEYINKLTDKIEVITNRLADLTQRFKLFLIIHTTSVMYQASILSNDDVWEDLLKVVASYKLLSIQINESSKSLGEFIKEQFKNEKDCKPSGGASIDQCNAIHNEIQDAVKISDNIAKISTKFDELNTYRTMLRVNNIKILFSLRDALGFANNFNRVTGREQTNYTATELSAIANFSNNNTIIIRNPAEEEIKQNIIAGFYCRCFNSIQQELNDYAAHKNHLYKIDVKNNQYSVPKRLIEGGHAAKAKFILDILVIIASDKATHKVKLKIIINRMQNEFEQNNEDIKLKGDEMKVLFKKLWTLVGNTENFINTMDSLVISRPTAEEVAPRSIGSPSAVVVEEADIAMAPTPSHILNVATESQGKGLIPGIISQKEDVSAASIFSWIQTFIKYAVFYKDVNFLEHITFLSQNQDYLDAHKGNVECKRLEVKVKVLTALEKKIGINETTTTDLNKDALIVYLQGVMAKQYDTDKDNQSWAGLISFFGGVTGDDYKYQNIKADLKASESEKQAALENRDTSEKSLEEILKKAINAKIDLEIKSIEKFVTFKECFIRYMTTPVQDYTKDNSMTGMIMVISQQRDSEFCDKGRAILGDFSGTKRYKDKDEIESLYGKSFLSKFIFKIASKHLSSPITLLHDILVDYNNNNISQDELRNKIKKQKISSQKDQDKKENEEDSPFVCKLKENCFKRLSALVMPSRQRYNSALQSVLDNNLFNIFTELLKDEINKKDKKKLERLVVVLLRMGASVTNKVERDRSALHALTDRKLDDLEQTDELKNPKTLITLSESFNIIIAFFKEKALFNEELAIHPKIKYLFVNLINKIEQYYNELVSHTQNAVKNETPITGEHAKRFDILKGLFILIDNMLNARDLEVIIEHAKLLKADLSASSTKLKAIQIWSVVLWTHDDGIWPSNDLVVIIGDIVIAMEDIKKAQKAGETVRERHFISVKEELDKEICKIAEPEFTDISTEDSQTIKDIVIGFVNDCINNVLQKGKLTNEFISSAIDTIIVKYDKYKQYKSCIKALYCYELVKAIEGQGYTYNEHTSVISTKPKSALSV